MSHWHSVPFYISANLCSNNIFGMYGVKWHDNTLHIKMHMQRVFVSFTFYGFDPLDVYYDFDTGFAGQGLVMPTWSQAVLGSLLELRLGKMQSQAFWEVKIVEILGTLWTEEEHHARSKRREGQVDQECDFKRFQRCRCRCQKHHVPKKMCASRTKIILGRCMAQQGSRRHECCQDAIAMRVHYSYCIGDRYMQVII